MGNVSSTGPQANGPPKAGNIGDFWKPSVLRYYINSNGKDSEAWKNGSDRSDFVAFVQRVFRYQTADGGLKLPQNYMNSLLDHLIQSLFAEVDKQLLFNSTFESMFKDLMDGMKPRKSKHQMKIPQPIAESESPEIDMVMQMFDETVTESSRYADLFVDMAKYWNPENDIFSKILVSMRHHLSAMLISDTPVAESIEVMLVKMVDNGKEKMYAVLILVDACLRSERVAAGVCDKMRSKSVTRDKSICGRGFTRLRARLGENSVVMSACHYRDRAFLLRQDNMLVDVTAQSIKICELAARINGPAKLATNGRFLFIVEHAVVIVLKMESLKTEVGRIDYVCDPGWELLCVCGGSGMELFMLFVNAESGKYKVDYVSSTLGQISVGIIKFSKAPLCMMYSPKVLVLRIIGARGVTFRYEFDSDSFTLAPTMQTVANIPTGWTVVSAQSRTVLVMKPARSHYQLAFVHVSDAKCYLPKVAAPATCDKARMNKVSIAISVLLERCLSQCGWFLRSLFVQDCVSTAPIEGRFDYRFLDFCLSVVDRAIDESSVDVNTCSQLSFVVLQLAVVRLSRGDVKEDSLSVDISALLLKIVRFLGTDLPGYVVLVIVVLVTKCFECIYRKKPWEVQELVRFIVQSHQANKEEFYLMAPVMSFSPLWIYVIDPEILKFLNRSTSLFTVASALDIRTVFLNEYLRCEQEGIDIGPLEKSLEIVCEGARLYMPKMLRLKFVCAVLVSAYREQASSLIVMFCQRATKLIAGFDQTSFPEKLISNKEPSGLITEQVIETRHPIGNRCEYCWDVSFPGACAIEAEFDPSCSILIDDQDVFQILGGSSATSPVVYEKEPKTSADFPSKLLIKSSSVRVIFHSFLGYHLYGLKITFRQIDSDESPRQCYVNSYQFAVNLFFFILGECWSLIMNERQENPKMNCCSFMGWMKRIDFANSINKSQTPLVPEVFMDQMELEMKLPRMIKPTEEHREIERYIVSAVFNQLGCTDVVLHRKQQVSCEPTQSIVKFTGNNTLRGGAHQMGIVSPQQRKIGGTRVNAAFRQSVAVPRTRLPMTPVSGGANDMQTFLKNLWRLLYQLRTRVHFAQQKAASSGGPSTVNFDVMRVKAEYFTQVKSVFQPGEREDSFEVMSSRASQLIRVISAEFSLNDMLRYVNGYVAYEENQKQMVELLGVITSEIRHQNLLMLMFYPVGRRMRDLVSSSRGRGVLQGFQTLLSTLTQRRFSACSNLDSSVRLMGILSNFTLFGVDESQSEAVFATMHSFVSDSHDAIAWQLFIHFCMNVSSELFENKMRLFFESGIFGPTFFIQTFLILNENETNLDFRIISQIMNDSRPSMIRSALLLLSAYFTKCLISEDFVIKHGSKSLDADEFLEWLLSMVGCCARGVRMSILVDKPNECHMLMASEIVSFFRICIKPASAASMRILKLFDTVLLSFVKNGCSVVTDAVIGVFAVVGEGFQSLNGSSYAIGAHSMSVMKIDGWSPLEGTCQLMDLLNYTLTSHETTRLIGCPRIPPNPSDYPMTSFRASAIHSIIENAERSQHDTAYAVLLAEAMLYLPICLQDEFSRKAMISEHIYDPLISLACIDSNEGQYHGMEELIEAAGQYVFKEEAPDESMRLVALNAYVSVGNNMLDSTQFYYEVTLLETLRGGKFSIGFITDDTTTQFHSFVALSLPTGVIVQNGVDIRDIKMNTQTLAGITIGCCYNKGLVTFRSSDGVLIDREIPMRCRRYTPLLIVKDTNVKLQFNFGDRPFLLPQTKTDCVPGTVVASEGDLSTPVCCSNSCDDDEYADFIRAQVGYTGCDRTVYEFKCVQSNPPPLFAKHKSRIESSSEVCEELMNVKGQQFVIENALSPFCGKVGHLVSHSGNTVSLELTDVEQGSVTTLDFEDSFVRPVNMHLFPVDSRSCLFRSLAIRASRYAILACLKELHDKVEKENMVKLLCHLIAEFAAVVDADEENETQRREAFWYSGFASSISFVPIIRAGYYKSLLTSFLATHASRYTDRLYHILIHKIRTIESCEEYARVIETTHPMSHCRVDRTFVTDGANSHLCIPLAVHVKQRGLLMKGNGPPQRVMQESDLEALIPGSSLYVNLAWNRTSHFYGVKVAIIPLCNGASDMAHQPISWLYHFGKGLVSFTVSKLPVIAIRELVPILVNEHHGIMKFFWYAMVSPIFFDRKLNDSLPMIDYCDETEHLYDVCYDMVEIFRQPCSILKVDVQRQAVIMLVSFVRMHAWQYKQIVSAIAKSTESDFRPFCDFQEMMISAQRFLDALDDPLLLFMMYLLAFCDSDVLCPYVIFYKEWTSRKNRKFVYAERYHEPGQSWLHIDSEAATRYEYTITTFSEGAAKSRDIVIYAVKDSFAEQPPDTSGKVLFMEDKLVDTYVRHVPPVENEDLHTPVARQSILDFILAMRAMAGWKGQHDEILVSHVGTADAVSDLRDHVLVKLRDFPESVISMRLTFLKALNDIFAGDVGHIPLIDHTRPLETLVIMASSGFSSEKKLARLEKAICRNFKHKKTMTFNRSRATIAREDPDSERGKSLFNQTVDQIPISRLSALKGRDAPWVVRLEGEGAIDVGGPGRDLFTELSTELCMPHNHLFVPSPRATEDTSIQEFIPDIKSPARSRFVYVGAFVALAFVTRLQQPYRFASLVWTYLANKKIKIEEIYEIDPGFKQYIEGIENGVGVSDLKYAVPSVAGDPVELIVEGAVTPVPPEDRERYCRLAKEYRISEFNPWLSKMKEGFSVFLADIHNFMVTPSELKTFICGSDEIPIERLQELIQIVNATREEEKMLIEVLEEFSSEERMLFIKFATGKMSIPAPGASWNSALNVAFVKLKPKVPPYRLPTATTCSSTVSIPKYPTKEVMAQKLRTAIAYGGDMVLDRALDVAGIVT